MNAPTKTQESAKGRTRDPEATRECLLHCAFQEIYEHGYAGASLDRILAHSGVTKGALYHHFGSKAELANAVIDEVIRPLVMERWADPIAESDDPITALREHLTEVMADFTDQEMACGCPLNNLVQELANAAEGFREHLARVYDEWRAGLAVAFARGKAAGNVRQDVDPAAAAAFIVASVEGLATTMKSSRDREVTGSAATMFLQFLESLRPAPAEAHAA
ncbi:MAG: TetR/AcrR family transcriptional regulator [Gemmatimonadota bacterium]